MAADPPDLQVRRRSEAMMATIPAQSGSPLEAVEQYLDAFNKGDESAMAARFAPDGSILDGMAPHVWRGSTASADWYRDVLVEGEHLGASFYSVAVGEPLHDAVTGDAAYLVLPATMRFDLKGQKVIQSGALFTIALEKVDGDWRIASWAWAKGTPRVDS